MTDGQLVLEIDNVTKRFGAITALDGISIRIGRGEVVGLVGDNGAGKSTLVKVISGVHQPTSGRMLLEGSPVEFPNPRTARDAGVETVFQDLALCDNLDIAANLFLGRELTRPGLGLLARLKQRTMQKQARRALDDVHIKIPGKMTDLVEKLSGGQRQAIAIARAAFWDSRLLLLDEPTAALGVEESREVVRIVDQLAAEGLPIILISHDMTQVMELCDRAYVLRQGQMSAEVSMEDADSQMLVEYITGARV